MTRAPFCLLFLLTFILPLPILCSADARPSQINSARLNVPLGGSPALGAIDELVKSPFYLGELTYSSDTPFEKEEFSYLMGLDEGDLITAQKLKKSISYLAKKNKFNVIQVSITTVSAVNNVKNINIKLESFWLVKHISVSGILNGRDAYRYLYDIDPGEAFDEKKHQHSLRNIKDELERQGYLSAKIKDTFTMDHRGKALSVNLNIQTGPRFRIGTVDVFCNSENQSIPQSELTLLREKVERIFAKKLERRPYSSLTLNKYGRAVKKFLAKKGFLQASVFLEERMKRTERRVDLAIKINLQAKKEFVFFGNHFFSDQQLQENILAFGQSTLIVPASLLAQELELLYQKRGFLKVKIESREEDSTCYFVIHEGKRAVVDKIVLKGAKRLHEELVKSGLYKRIKKHSFFDEDQLKKLIAYLESFYRKSGFALVHVFYEPRKVPGTSNHYTIHIHVDEGKRYYLDKVSVPLFPELEQQGPFLELSRANARIPFDGQQLLLQRRWLSDHLHKLGYLYLDIKPVVTVKQGSVCLVEVEWQITLHQDKVTFGKTVVIGSCPLPFKSFMRELHYSQGEPWNKQSLESSLFRLRDLALFSNIHLYPESIAVPESEKTIMAKLIEDDPFEVRWRAGVLGVAKNLTWREGATYKVGSSLLFKNIFDSGGQLRFDADLTRFERYVSGYYIYPWLFGMPYTTITKAYSNRYIQPLVQGSREQLYVAIQQGFVLGLNRKYTNVTTGMNVGFEWMETELKNKAAAQAINFAPSLVDVKIPYLHMEPTLVVDYLDDKLYPTIGSFTLASVKGMIPLKKVDDSLIKVLLEQSFFYPVYRSLIAGFRFRVGHIFNQCFNQIMPPERFYLGGANSVRGYEPDYAPPLGCFSGTGNKKKLVPQGGKSMLNMNLELRFPFFKSFTGALFQDAGVLLGDEVSVIKEQFVAATGGGIRYNTPVGPFRFDIGFKWKKLRPEDSRIAWYLTLGNAF